MTASDRARELAQVAATAAEEKIGRDIVALDVSATFPLADVFVLVTGSNERQVEAIVDAVEDAMIAAGQKPLRKEGKGHGQWVLLDFSEIIVHVFHEEQREFYALERLWKEAPQVELALGDPRGDRAQGHAEPVEQDAVVREQDPEERAGE